MKNWKFLILSLLLATPAFANDGTTDIRCAGTTSAGLNISIFIELDPADRIISLTTFVDHFRNEINLGDLGAPSHFVKVNAQNKLRIFGLKSFNDGLEEVISIAYVDGQPKLSTLKIGDGKENTATANIVCKII